MKKLMFLLLASVLLLSACSSGGGNASTSSDPAAKEITIWAWDKNFNVAALELAKAKYMQSHPDVKINIVENAQADIVQKLNTGLNSGTTKGLPNVVLIEDYRSQNFLQAYPDAFRDMSDKIKAADFADYKIGPTSYEGKQYGIPFDSGVTGLYVRTDYLKQAGYTPDDLKNITWDQYIEIGKKVKAATGKDMLSQDPNDLGLIRAMIQSAGSWYMKEDGMTPNIAGNAALKKALETYKAMYDANIVKPNSDWSQFLAAFNSGAVASVPTGNWITPSVKAEASQSGKWAVEPFPVLSDVPNSVHASNIGGSSWYVMNVDGKDTAADFMASTFGSDKDLYQEMLSKIGIIGTLKAASEGGAYDKADEFFGGQKIYADFAKWTTEVPKINYGLHTYAIEDIMTVELQNYLSGSKDVDTMMNDVQTQAEAQLK
ncbi:ABC transporter substrate-binding protein [Paenibacillus campi]|uniref:ABC transporter substrate-binding protein n=1 Tax=Paenibacillus campi TaxID=3106031 RepID=UPI002AFDE9A4|nr:MULTISPECIES: extracellular solute-binding protein [unclassified Paenibacillus]